MSLWLGMSRIKGIIFATSLKRKIKHIEKYFENVVRLRLIFIALFLISNMSPQTTQAKIPVCAQAQKPRPRQLTIHGCEPGSVTFPETILGFWSSGMMGVSGTTRRPHSSGSMATSGGDADGTAAWRGRKKLLVV